MSAREIVRECLGKLGAQSGLALDLDDGVCAIAFEGGTECVVEAVDDTGLLLLHAEVVEVLDGSRARLMEEAMALNLYGLATEGGTLALDRGSNAIILSFARPAAGLDGEGFAILLAGFIETVERLRDRLFDLDPKPEADQPDADSSVGDDHVPDRFITLRG